MSRTHKPIRSEVEIKLASDQILNLQKEIDFDIRDFTVGYLCQRFLEGNFYIPGYQREYIWRRKNRIAFIESLILGLPIPFMFVADTDDGRLEIVDGVQRIQTIVSFLDGSLKLTKLEKLTELEGFKFRDLPEPQQRKLMNRALRLIVLEDATTLDIRHEIFKRINTTGMRAKPSEIRRGSYRGEFMTFIAHCAKHPLLLELCPIGKKMVLRREPEELVVRFFAYSENYMAFRHDVDKFLDAFAQDMTESGFPRKRFDSEFTRMLEFVKEHFPHGFAKTPSSSSTPRVRFEAISVGVNLALKEKPDLIPRNVRGWLGCDAFTEHTTTHASNSPRRLRGRVEFVRDSLLKGILK